MADQSINGGPQTVVAVERAFAVLHALAAAPESLGVSALARATGLAKSTVSRLLVTLGRLGMVERVGADGRYGLGAGLAALAPRATTSLVALARPHLQGLVEEIGEDAGLAVTDGTEVLYLEHVHVAGAVQMQDWTGSRLPAHAVAAGMVLMREWRDEQLTAYLAGPLAALTPATVVDAKVLRRRIRGWDSYVWTHCEFAADVNGVAAPVRGSDGAIVAAVNVYGPSYRFPGDRSEEWIGSLVGAAGDEITRLIAAISTERVP